MGTLHEGLNTVRSPNVHYGAMGGTRNFVAAIAASLVGSRGRFHIPGLQLIFDVELKYDERSPDLMRLGVPSLYVVSPENTGSHQFLIFKSRKPLPHSAGRLDKTIALAGTHPTKKLTMLITSSWCQLASAFPQQLTTGAATAALLQHD